MTAKLRSTGPTWSMDLSNGQTFRTSIPSRVPAHRAAAALRRDFPAWEIQEPADSLRLFDDEPAAPFHATNPGLFEEH